MSLQFLKGFLYNRGSKKSIVTSSIVLHVLYFKLVCRSLLWKVKVILSAPLTFISSDRLEGTSSSLFSLKKRSISGAFIFVFKNFHRRGSWVVLDIKRYRTNFLMVGNFCINLEVALPPFPTVEDAAKSAIWLAWCIQTSFCSKYPP